MTKSKYIFAFLRKIFIEQLSSVALFGKQINNVVLIWNFGVENKMSVHVVCFDSST